MSAVTSNANEIRMAYRVRVTGHVQGVGFRPFVKRLADELGLAGGVGNDSAGVFVEVEGKRSQIESFMSRLQLDGPDAARLESATMEAAEVRDRHRFVILPCPQERPGPCRARVPRDRAVCEECLAESLDPADRRFRYPFTACTTCGPRYTLLRKMPYERYGTSMREFPLCPACEQEFSDAENRRFHAEAMACAHCGPRVALQERTDDDAVCLAADALRHGEIVAIKGLGGYQLLTRADDGSAVARLRARKHRPTKPLAVMVRSLAEATQYATLNSFERELLASPENPIVVVALRPDANLAGDRAASESRRIDAADHAPASPATRTCSLSRGRDERQPGRRADPRRRCDACRPCGACRRDFDAQSPDRETARRLGRADNLGPAEPNSSGTRLRPVAADIPGTLARSSGPHRPAGGILALGGQQKNAVALWTGTQAILGPHLGDLESERTRATWRRQLDDLADLYGTEIRSLVVDLHPDYAARRWAEQSGLPVIEVGHHHAHAAAAMVEHNLLHRTVLALTWDGTGLGPDGTLWGGECLRASLLSCERVATLRPLRLPGGEAAIRQPFRIGVAMLREAIGAEIDFPWPDVSPEAVRGISQLLDRDILCPTTTSLGRLFDGIASLLLGVSGVSYEGEAAAWLESVADRAEFESYPVTIERRQEMLLWDWRSVVRALIADRDRGVPASILAARFHNSIARWAQVVARDCSEENVVLAGGCFQNALLTERVSVSLEAIGKRVFCPGVIPVNDGGLAAGQLAIGLARQLDSEGTSCV